MKELLKYNQIKYSGHDFDIFLKGMVKASLRSADVFRSSLLSLRKITIIFRTERSDDWKYVCASQVRSKLTVTKVQKEEAFLSIHYLRVGC